MKKPEPWAYETVNQLENEGVWLNAYQYEALAYVVSVLGPGPFKQTLLYKSLLAQDMESAYIQIQRLASYSREPKVNKVLSHALNLFVQHIDDPVPEEPKKPKSKMWLIWVGVIVAALASVFVLL